MRFHQLKVTFEWQNYVVKALKIVLLFARDSNPGFIHGLIRRLFGSRSYINVQFLLSYRVFPYPASQSKACRAIVSAMQMTHSWRGNFQPHFAAAETPR